MRVHGRIPVLATIGVLGAMIAFPARAPAAANLRVRGSQLIDGLGRGHVVQRAG